MDASEYRLQTCSRTLREAVAIYRRENPEFDEAAQGNPEAETFFQGHDVCHVVFGCGTTPDEELLADAWTLLGTDVTLKQFLGFLRLPEHVDIVRKVGMPGACGAVVRVAPRLFRLMWRARGLERPWPWVRHKQYLDVSLATIRQEFGIRVLSS